MVPEQFLQSLVRWLVLYSENFSGALRFQDLPDVSRQFQADSNGIQLTQVPISHPETLFRPQSFLAGLCFEILNEAIGLFNGNLCQSAVFVEYGEELSLGCRFRREITYQAKSVFPFPAQEMELILTNKEP